MARWLEPPPPRTPPREPEPAPPAQPSGEMPEHLQRRQRHAALGGRSSADPAMNPEIQAMREEARTHYATPGLPEPTVAPVKKTRRWGFIGLFAGVTVLSLGAAVISLINALYVRNAGQTIQSLTMLHIEVAAVAVALILNSAMIFIRRG